MAYKTILVHLDDSAQSKVRLKVTCDIAKSQGAHLVGAAANGNLGALYGAWGHGLGSIDMSLYFEESKRRATHALQHFDSTVPAIVSSFESQLIDDEATRGIGDLAHYSDLVVLGQYDPEDNSSPITYDLTEYVMFQSGVPVMVIPHSGQFEKVGGEC